MAETESYSYKLGVDYLEFGVAPGRVYTAALFVGPVARKQAQQRTNTSGGVLGTRWETIWGKTGQRKK